MAKWFALDPLLRHLRGSPEPSLARSVAPAALPCIPPGQRVYIIGDVHGRRDLLRRAFDKIDKDLRRRPVARSTEILLGDYVDRGPDSKGVIDTLIERQGMRETVCLSGNHEWMLGEVFREPRLLVDWQRHGIVETMISYGVTPPPQIGPSDCAALAEALRLRIPDDHHRFLRLLLLHASIGDYFFVHAGVRPGVPLDEQTAQDCLWIREEFLAFEGSFGKVVIHGHTPVRSPSVHPNRINIDTGAYRTGVLTCLILEGTERALLE